MQVSALSTVQYERKIEPSKQLVSAIVEHGDKEFVGIITKQLVTYYAIAPLGINFGKGFYYGKSDYMFWGDKTGCGDKYV